jgi:hypothetical protein
MINGLEACLTLYKSDDSKQPTTTTTNNEYKKPEDLYQKRMQQFIQLQPKRTDAFLSYD